jgi:hypothetical protein
MSHNSEQQQENLPCQGKKTTLPLPRKGKKMKSLFEERFREMFHNSEKTTVSKQQ